MSPEVIRRMSGLPGKPGKGLIGKLFIRKKTGAGNSAREKLSGYSMNSSERMGRLSTPPEEYPETFTNSGNRKIHAIITLNTGTPAWGMR